MEVKYMLVYTYYKSLGLRNFYLPFDNLDKALIKKNRLLSSPNVESVLLFELRDVFLREDV